MRAFENYTGEQKKNALSQWIYRQYASPVWMDIRRNRMLPYQDAKENQEERHVCPLQLDVIERCLTLWSNPGDIVLSPFAGVGSELYGAIINGRRAVGCELKASYYRQALRNVQLASNYKPDEGNGLAETTSPDEDLDDADEEEERPMDFQEEKESE